MPARQIAPKTQDLAVRACRVVAPPPKMTVSEWADAYRVLPETSPEPGKWRTSRTPYLKEPMDACCDPTVHRVVLMFASQTGKSEAILNVTGYYMDYDPSAMMIVQPNQKPLAEDFSKDRLAKMISSCPRLSAKVSEAKSRDASNTLLRKEFPGGYCVLAGANSPGDLAGRPLRLVMPDEIDRFPSSVAGEGDPIELAAQRSANFWNSLMVLSSTPTTKGSSRIEKAFAASTQEHWCLPCPSCGCYQSLDWERRVSDLASMACAVCGSIHDEYEWKSEPGEWIPANEGHKTRGFHLNAMASPWVSWASLVEMWREANEGGPETLQVFINTKLAQTWEIRGSAVETDSIANRREVYDCDVPDGVLLLTCGVDVHPDRIEAEVVGWGRNAENWGIQKAVFIGDPGFDDVWNDLDDLIQQSWTRDDGKPVRIWRTCVDSGYMKDRVYDFCRPRRVRGVYACKGFGEPGRPMVSKASWVGVNSDTLLIPVGTNAAKDLLLTRLQVKLGEGEKRKASFCHFPLEDTLSNGVMRGYTQEYFEQLTAEKRIPQKVKTHTVYVWVLKSAHRRNEALDCRVYAEVALQLKKPNWDAVERYVNGAAQPSSGSAGQRRRRVLSRGVGV